MLKLTKSMLIPALVFLLTLAAALPALAGDDGGVVTNERTGEQYETITAAVAEAEEGDELIVGAGTYSESVVIDKALTITGKSGALVEGVYDYTFAIKASGVALKGLTIRNGSESEGKSYDCCNCAVLVDYDYLESEDYDAVSWSITGCHLDGDGKAEDGIHVCGDVAIPSSIVIAGNTIEDFVEDGIDFFSCSYFVKNITLTVKDNEIKDVEYGISFEKLYDSSVTLEDNTIESEWDCIYLVYLEDCDFTVKDCTLLSTESSNIYLEEEDEEDDNYQDFIVRGTFTVVGNNLQAGDYCIDLGLILESELFKIKENDFTGLGGLYSEGCLDSTIEIGENSFQVEYDALYFEIIFDSDVIISGNTIAIDCDQSDEFLFGIYCPAASGAINIENNVITAESRNVDTEGICIYIEEDYILTGSGADINADINIKDNRGNNSSKGNKFSGLNGKEVEVKENYVTDYGADINIEGNRFSGLTYGIHLYIDEAIRDLFRVDIHENIFLENEHGLSLDLALNNPDSAVTVFNNLFHQNEYGILVEYLFDDTAAERVTAYLNSFTGNTEAGITNFMEEIIFNAPLNWWGSEAGPSTEGNETGGDAVEGAVNYEPWLKKLKLSTSGSKLADGGKNRLRATLLDSDDNVVDTDLLSVLFKVSGANKYSKVVQLDGGIATFSYRDLSPGTDTISVRLLFAGEVAGEDEEGLSMVSEAQTSWVEAAGGDEEEEDEDYRQREMPRTGAAGSMLPAAMGLACLLAGAALRLWRRNGANLSGNR